MFSSSEQIGRVRSSQVKLPVYDPIGEEIVPRIEPCVRVGKQTYAETDWEIKTCLRCSQEFESQGHRLCENCNAINAKQALSARLMQGANGMVRKFLPGDPISRPD